MNELENLYIKRQEIIDKINKAEDKYNACYNEWLGLYGEVLDYCNKGVIFGISNVQIDRIKNDLRDSIEEKEKYEQELSEIEAEIKDFN